MGENQLSLGHKRKVKMKNDLIKEFVKSQLLEIARYERETGKLYSEDVREEIKILVSSDPIPEYGFTMTKIPKVGVNPQTVYSTPAGVFFYPLNQEYYERLISNTLPYVSDAPYCSILKLNGISGDRWLKFIEPGQDYASRQKVDESLEELEELLKVLRNDPKNLQDPWIFDAEIFAKRRGRDWRFNNDSKVYAATDLATRKSPSPTFAWTALLRKLGYIGAYDGGNSIIHGGEPFQGLCLDSRSYTVVKSYETALIRKTSELTGQKLNVVRAHLIMDDEVPENKLLYLIGVHEKLAYAAASRNDLSSRVVSALLNSGHPRIEFYLSTNKSPGVTSEVLMKILDKKDMEEEYREEVENEMSSRRDLPPEVEKRLLNSPLVRPFAKDRILNRNSRTEIDDF